MCEVWASPSSRSGESILILKPTSCSTWISHGGHQPILKNLSVESGRFISRHIA